MTRALDNALAVGNLTRNRILNPAFQVSQEYATGAGPTVTTGGIYVMDGWVGVNNTDGTMTSAQVTTGGIAPSGSPMRVALACTVVDASLAAGQYAEILQPLEGLNLADLEWGTTNAKSIVLRFYVKTSMAGAYGVSLVNSATNRCYVQTFTVAAGEVNTDKLVTLVIPGDTTGTWLKDTGVGIYLRICLASGTTALTASTGWQAGNFLGITGSQVNFMSSTAGSAFYLADVGLYEGTAAPPFEVPSYQEELRRCQRYWENGTFHVIGAGYAANAVISNRVSFKNTKRAAPTVAINVTFRTGMNASEGVSFTQTDSVTVSGTTTGITTGAESQGTWTANARL
jgi:hypothetical protein